MAARTYKQTIATSLVLYHISEIEQFGKFSAVIVQKTLDALSSRKHVQMSQ